MIDPENIELAYKKAKRGKMWQKKVRRVEANKEVLLEDIRQSLINKTFHTGKYKIKKVYEPKERTISVLPFYPDRIVQHALLQVLIPIWEPLMISDSYACRVGKGQHKASTKAMEYIRKNKYCLQCDVSKFYPTIDHDVLKAVIRRKIKDKDVLWLLDDIIDSTEIGVPIGNYTSQWFGNLYLNELDQRAKHVHHARHYIRYCDDFVVFAKSKETLHEILSDMGTYLQDCLRQRLSRGNVFRSICGLDFLGYRHFPDGKILVRKKTAKRIRKRIRMIPWQYKHGIITAEQAVSKVASAKSWLKHANTYNFQKAAGLEGLWEEVRQYT